MTARKSLRARGCGWQSTETPNSVAGEYFLWREGGDDFFEARIAAERIPPRHQFQFAIADVAGRLDDDGELFAGEIFFSNPRCNHCEVSGEVLADERIFLHRKKLKCAATFAQRFLFSAEAGVDHAQHTPGRAEIGLRLDNFRLLDARGGKCQLRFALVVDYARDQAFNKCAIKLNLVPQVNLVFLQRAQSLGCGSAITFRQCAGEPILSDSPSGGICRPNGVDCLMQWA